MSDILAQIADKIGKLEAENAALKRENERAIELLINFVNSEEGDYDALVHAHRFLETKCNCDNELPPCRICTLLTAEEPE